MTSPAGASPDTAALPPAPRSRRWDTVVGRTVVVAVTAASITAFVALAVSLPLIRNAATEQAQATLANLADVSAATLQDPRPGSLARLSVLLTSQDTEAFLVLPGAATPDVVPDEMLAPLMEGEPVSDTFEAQGREWLLEGRPVGTGGIVLVAPVDIASDAVQRNFRLLVVALLLGLAAAVGVALAVSRPVTAPMRRVAEGAEQLVAGRRDVRVGTDGPAEVAEIADAINRLSAALEMSEGRQREFLLSVSHELRTPLTAIAGYSEALADGVVTDSEVPRTGELMAGEARRLDRLVSDLLDLSRLGAADLRIERRPTDLNELLQDAAEVWGDLCRREGLQLAVDSPDGPVVVQTDPDRVRQIIDNLLGNALRVTPAGGIIVLALHPDAAAALLQVRDNGPGLSDDDLAVAFEPGVLYTRYRGVRPVGTGVGLALVGRLATRLGGSAEAGQAAEGGACFTVRLPLGPIA